MTKYWMADDARTVISKFQSYHDDGSMRNITCPMGQTWVRNTHAYYGNVLEANSFETSLVYAGEMGELVRMMVPQARSLIRQLVTLITKQKLSFKAIAEKKGTDVVQETRLGNAIAVNITKDQDLDEKGEDLVELSLVQGMSFIEAGWRTDRGELLAFDKGRPLYNGDLELANRNVFNVLWNHRIRDWKDQWLVETRSRMNRWSLIAQLPHLKSAILAVPSAVDFSTSYSGGVGDLFAEDEIWVYRIYHAPTPALTRGRMIMYADIDTVFYDGINPFGCIPVEPMIPERIDGFSLGYPILSNLLPCQEMLDHSLSAWATNQSATAVQNIATPRGANISYEEIAGMNWFTYTPVPGAANGGLPQGINLSNTSDQTMKFIPELMKHMQDMSNISAALRGAPPPGVTAGRAIATLVANALEFISSSDKAYSKTAEKVMMHGINCIRRFAKREKIVQIAGRNWETYSKTFVGTDLDPIKSVEIQRVNPMMQTYSGRMELAEMLQKSGYTKDAQHFLSILEGADPREAYETELSEEDLIQSENERLMEGLPVLALSSDNHPGHIRKHMALLNDPNVRNDNAKVANILQHCLMDAQNGHFALAKLTDPRFAAMVRTGQMPQLGPPPGPQPGPGGEGPVGPPPGGPVSALGGGPDGEPETMPAEPANDPLERAA